MNKGEVVLEFVVHYSWELFIAAEVLSLGSLILFGIFRYFLNKPKLGVLFILLFLFLLTAEALLGVYVYEQTGEISTFLIVITIFVIYACTFGIVDFLRLDRWMRSKIGKMRGVELLTEKDYAIMRRNKDPKYIAKKYRISSLIHLVIFLVVQTIFWSLGTDSWQEMKSYLTDLSWLEQGEAKNSPYPNETIFSIGMIWSIVFVADFIYSWSYTIFPSKG
ncbi:hypothetical protein J32TS6_17810 [Virgibacillus pantothenticus]|uniref:Integral membrane protein n=1 Tax=Virgibacillus pantothenticus TaxID=1473 RepID=A0A0L0QUK4_VIRPA|nr:MULTISPECIES: hypothetical protein [Virgibacillus]API92588.1 hypothetical protein BKP57_12720 [Virgibacillus sp. 6R]KNE22365.1 hypothetical protein AFK71_01720 [Virgibacillus pantothenticus]MEB5453460.1 hypothetical protein [Virgibacillus pantothenticus]MEB5457708.1 hypothetical protein [Virgibacillus pantothenticus]MEB5461738.1 hypothetical protein [Virgibacillus pantothenticus]